MLAKHEILALVFSIAVFVSLLLFYTAYDKITGTLVPQKLVDVVLFVDFSNSLRELNKVAALAGLGLISFSLIVGPFSKMFPKTFARFLPWRKITGLSGFTFALLHSVYSLIVIYGLNLDRMIFSNPKLLGFVSAAIAFTIFLAMSITSTRSAVQKMGYKNWKLLQTTGYIALFFSIIHFVVLETGKKGFDVRPYGILFLFFAIVALAVRVGTVFVKTKPRSSFEEHVGEKP
ncbi:MAG: ferric reductase-like transmembrane domain-containing protein [Candidatus Diapherotrites archaeon]|nr:ferric reductase-like transmembrane domain-containing protein [Candidatus Diapherotrites archaeon]